MTLLAAGVPYHLAFGSERPLSRARKLAMTVWYGQQQGGRWSWASMRWEKPKP